MKTINFSLTVLFALVLTFSSCKKDDVSTDGILSDNISTMQDVSLANDLMTDIENESDDIVNGNSELKSGTDDTTNLSGRQVVWTLNDDGTRTAVVTYTNFQHPKAKNECVKNGVIRIVVTGRRHDNTYKRVVTFENFTINDNKVEGTKTIEKIADLQYRITMVGGKITFTDGTTFTTDFTRIRTMVEGAATPLYVWDDAFTFEGSATGLTRNELNYSKVITSPVKIYTAYKFPVSGSFTLTIGEKVFTLDYGDGTKDNLAVISRNGRTKEITLRKN
jgi:hypothetical protein